MKHAMLSGRQDLVDGLTLLVRSARLGDTSQQAWNVASSARVALTAAAMFILTALPFSTCLSATGPPTNLKTASSRDDRENAFKRCALLWSLTHNPSPTEAHTRLSNTAMTVDCCDGFIKQRTTAPSCMRRRHRQATAIAAPQNLLHTSQTKKKKASTFLKQTDGTREAQQRNGLMVSRHMTVPK